MVARYGDLRLPAAVYDLEAARNTIDLAKLPQAKFADGGALRTAGPLRPRAARRAIAPGPSLDPAAFKYVRAVDAAVEGSEKVSGLVALPLEATSSLTVAGPSSRFSDVRVLDSAGRQVPYIVERRNEPLSIALTLKPASEETVVR